MTVSMRVMSAGDGYKYLLRTVAAGDGDRSLSTPLTRYYAGAGTPPGRWLGSGVAALGHGELTPGAQVSEAQLQLLVGMDATRSRVTRWGGRIRRTARRLIGSRVVSRNLTRRWGGGGAGSEGCADRGGGGCAGVAACGGGV